MLQRFDPARVHEIETRSLPVTMRTLFPTLSAVAAPTTAAGASAIAVPAQSTYAQQQQSGQLLMTVTFALQPVAPADAASRRSSREGSPSGSPSGSPPSSPARSIHPAASNANAVCANALFILAVVLYSLSAFLSDTAAAKRRMERLCSQAQQTLAVECADDASVATLAWTMHDAVDSLQAPIVPRDVLLERRAACVPQQSLAFLCSGPKASSDAPQRADELAKALQQQRPIVSDTNGTIALQNVAMTLRHIADSCQRVESMRCDAALRAYVPFVATHTDIAFEELVRYLPRIPREDGEHGASRALDGSTSPANVAQQLALAMEAKRLDFWHYLRLASIVAFVVASFLTLTLAAQVFRARRMAVVQLFVSGVVVFAHTVFVHKAAAELQLWLLQRDVPWAPPEALGPVAQQLRSWLWNGAALVFTTTSDVAAVVAFVGTVAQHVSVLSLVLCAGFVLFVLATAQCKRFCDAEQVANDACEVMDHDPHNLPPAAAQAPMNLLWPVATVSTLVLLQPECTLTLLVATVTSSLHLSWALSSPASIDADMHCLDTCVRKTANAVQREVRLQFPTRFAQLEPAYSAAMAVPRTIRTAARCIIGCLAAFPCLVVMRIVRDASIAELIVLVASSRGALYVLLPLAALIGSFGTSFLSPEVTIEREVRNEFWRCLHSKFVRAGRHGVCARTS